MPQANLTAPDPTWTTATVTSHPAYNIYETLYSAHGSLATKQVASSGSDRLVADDYLSGSRSVFAKFDAYQPRQEPPVCATGGIARFDRLDPWNLRRA